MSIEMQELQASSEIQQFSGCATHIEQGEWLAAQGMLRAAHPDFTVTTERPWSMLGSESYILQFAVGGPQDDIRHFIAKACLKLPVVPSLNDWITRRKLLDEAGVAVPGLYAVQGGTLIEEYISYTFKEAYAIANPELRNDLCETFLSTYGRIYELGFRPTSMHDVRSRGDDVVVIDFGSDLGGLSREASDLTSQEVAFRARSEIQRMLGELCLSDLA